MNNEVFTDLKTKHCPKCKTVKPAGAFRRRSNAPEQLESYCKACHLERVRFARAKARAPIPMPAYDVDSGLFPFDERKKFKGRPGVALKKSIYPAFTENSHG